ncbi:MAG: hypothetical protein ACI8ZX_001936 [Planctomycetota bacterium]|jgi:hypothetical protein
MKTMKTILSILFVAIFALQGIAQNSNLTVFSEDGLAFYLILNGVRQNESPETNVRVDGLMNPYYSTKIIFADESRPNIEKKMTMVVDADSNRGEVTYKVKANKKGQQVMRYFSFTPAAQVLPPSPSLAVVTYNTAPMPAINFNAQVSETTTTTTTTGTTTNASISATDNINVGISVGGMSIGANINVNDHPGHNHTGHSHISHTTTTTTTNVGNNMPTTTCAPMDKSTFQSALSSIKGQSFSDSQLSQAKQITTSNICFTASQIKSITEIFSFEDAKLEYAKFAYDYCLDRNNYWQINEVFNFSSTTEELNSFVKNK